MSRSRPVVVPLAGCEARLRDELEAGGAALAVGRFSTGAGAHAYTMASSNVHTAIAKQVRWGVVDLTAAVPNERQLAHDLGVSRDRASGTDHKGRPFVNRFLTVDLPSGVTVHISAGSGRKIDAHTLHQPAVLRLAREVLRVRPVLVIAADASRWARDGWALGPWVEAMKQLEEENGAPIYLSSGGEPATPFDEFHEQRLMIQVHQAAAHAKATRKLMLDGFARLKEVVYPGTGWIPWPHHQSPPTTWDAAWIRDPARPGRGLHVAFPDTPEDRPPEELIIYGASRVMRPNEKGVPEVVNQVAVLRELVDHRFLDGWSPTRCTREAFERGFSTHGLRQRRGNPAAEFADPPPNTSLPDRDRTRDGCRAITTHREFFRTGELLVHVPDREDPVRYKNMVPSGGYGTPKALARWATAAERDQRQQQQARTYLIGHLKGTWHGVPIALVGFLDGSGAVHYYGRPRPGHRAPAGRPRPEFPATAMELSWLDGLADGHAALTWVTGPAAEPTPDEEQANLAGAKRTVLEATKRKAAAWTTLAYLTRDGAAEDASVTQARAEHNQAAAALTQAENRLAAAQQRLAERERPRTAAGLAVEDALIKLDRLSNPLDVTDSATWKAAIADLMFTTRRERRHGFTVYVTEWTGTLLLAKDGQSRRVPFRGRHVRLAHRRDGEKMRRLVEDLRNGRPLPDSPGEARLLMRLRAVLGLPDGSPFPVGTVRDPRILRVGMAICHPPPAVATEVEGIEGLPLLGGPPLTRHQLRGAARRLGEPHALVRRIHDLDTPPGAGQRRWVTKGDNAEAIAFRYAADHDGRLPEAAFTHGQWWSLRRVADHGAHCREWRRAPGGRELTPCPHCGGRRRFPLRIREATEPVCLDCELDTAGIGWPMRDYSLWLLQVRDLGSTDRDVVVVGDRPKPGGHVGSPHERDRAGPARGRPSSRSRRTHRP